MYNYNEFNSKKYIFLLILICFLFTIFIIKAFEYLPSKNIPQSTEYNVENTKSAASSNEVTDEEDVSDVVSQPEERHGVLYRSSNSLSDEQNFDEIDAPKGAVEEDFGQIETKGDNSQLSSEELALKSIINARNYMSLGNYSSALSEYQSALDSSNNSEMKAQCYEGMALIYAKQKKYSTALSFAGKAYNTSPSSSREVLIAKIYYSAGKTDVAVKRINNLLKSGFDN